MRPTRRAFLTTAASVWAAPALLKACSHTARKTRNVMVVTLDGFRPEEMFGGAAEALLTKRAGVADETATRKDFWRDDAAARRSALMPFVWSTVATKGQLYGDFAANSRAILTNGKKFSYPGYNEMFTGAPDDRVDSNDKVPNPNINVFEWLNEKPDFRDRVAAFCCWDVFPYILNRERSKLLVHAGWEPIPGASDSDVKRLLNRMLANLPRDWGNSHYDALAFEAGLDHLQTQRPRVMYFGFGETDEYAHEGRYDRYLDAAHRADAMIERLWLTLQGMPEYQGTTSLVLTTDHGRGGIPDGWKNHGANVEGAENIWIGVLGPDTAALGARRDCETVRQSQVAATIAALLGEDFCAAIPNAAPPIAEAIGSS